MTDHETPQVVKDVWKAIMNDSWMNIVVWGQPRTVKTILISVNYLPLFAN